MGREMDYSRLAVLLSKMKEGSKNHRQIIKIIEITSRYSI